MSTVTTVHERCLLVAAYATLKKNIPMSQLSGLLNANALDIEMFMTLNGVFCCN